VLIRKSSPISEAEDCSFCNEFVGVVRTMRNSIRGTGRDGKKTGREHVFSLTKTRKHTNVAKEREDTSEEIGKEKHNKNLLVRYLPIK
jgi:hypothetical protein